MNKDATLHISRRGSNLVYRVAVDKVVFPVSRTEIVLELSDV